MPICLQKVPCNTSSLLQRILGGAPGVCKETGSLQCVVLRTNRCLLERMFHAAMAEYIESVDHSRGTSAVVRYLVDEIFMPGEKDV
ncbi:MAG TPA: hypothetical protein EYP67_01565 [Methanosarcinales archaeon]|nr:hypothetical protein [Methanosarcinales archaeon]